MQEKEGKTFLPLLTWYLVLSNRLIEFMKATDMPNGLSGVGYSEKDIPDLVSGKQNFEFSDLKKGAWPQRRVIENAPLKVEKVLVC